MIFIINYKWRSEKLSRHSLEGADNPLPTSSARFAVDSSAKFPKIIERLFWAEIGSVCFEDQ